MGFRYTRRVAFVETDLAGIVHFSTFFRYMEEAEHALWRAAGIPVFQAMNNAGWPRVSATFDYKAPLNFEDRFEVDVEIASVTRRSLTYTFTLTRDAALIGTGTLTAVCAERREGVLRAVEIPAEVVTRLREAVGPPAAER
jgi:acyl-CoA thioester hydrolase